MHTSLLIFPSIPPSLPPSPSTQVKYSAERALKHLCEGTTAAEVAAGVAPGQSSAVTQYLAAATSTSGTNATGAAERESAVATKDYMRRVLATLPVDSDNEGSD